MFLLKQLKEVIFSLQKNYFLAWSVPLQYNAQENSYIEVCSKHIFLYYHDNFQKHLVIWHHLERGESALAGTESYLYCQSNESGNKGQLNSLVEQVVSFSSGSSSLVHAHTSHLSIDSKIKFISHRIIAMFFSRTTNQSTVSTYLCMVSHPGMTVIINETFLFYSKQYTSLNNKR